jgi:hypothetical protein
VFSQASTGRDSASRTPCGSCTTARGDLSHHLPDGPLVPRLACLATQLAALGKIPFPHYRIVLFTRLRASRRVIRNVPAIFCENGGTPPYDDTFK